MLPLATSLAILLSLTAGQDPPPVANSVLDNLTTKGVEVAPGDLRLLPTPSFAPDMTKEQQDEALQEIADLRNLSVKQFSPNSRAAPHAYRVTKLEIDEQGVPVPEPDPKDKEKPAAAGAKKNTRVAQKIEFWFVAYGTIEAVNDGNLFGELAPAINKEEGERGDARSLTTEELEARQLAIKDEKTYRENYILLDVPILNEIQVTGLCFAVQTASDEHVLAALQFEPALAADQQYPTQWQRMDRKQGKFIFGPPQPYSGFGGYAQATALQSIPGALLVEVHLLLSEPRDWFGGKNQIGAKLPALIDSNVKKFRDKLKAAEKRRKAAAAQADAG